MSSVQIVSDAGDENASVTPHKTLDSVNAKEACTDTPSRAAAMVTPPLKEVTNNLASDTGLTPTPVQDSSAAPTYGSDDEVNESYCLNPLFSPAAESTRTKELAQTPQQKLPQRQWTVPKGLAEQAPATPLADGEDTPAQATSPVDDVASKLENLTTDDDASPSP